MNQRGVIDVISLYYQDTNANIHRGLHSLSQEAIEAPPRRRPAPL